MNWKSTATAVLACALLIGATAPTNALAAGDRTTKFRVYQNDSALKEFSDKDQAIAYAKGFKNVYVEQIGTRAWVWNNYPSFKVYQKEKSKPEWEFATMEAAVAEAKKWANASVRKLDGGGWAWDNYPDHPGYALYQGDNTLPGWTFPTLDKPILSISRRTSGCGTTCRRIERRSCARVRTPTASTRARRRSRAGRSLIWKTP